jgi:uncharacterized protein
VAKRSTIDRRRLVRALGLAACGALPLCVWANRVPPYLIEDDRRARGVLPASLKAGFDLPDKPGVLSWKVLGAVQHEKHLPPPGSKWGYVMAPLYPPALTRLNGQRVRMQGFVAPFRLGDTHTEFLLSARTTDCNFCVAGGPESFAHVLAREAVKPSQELVVLEGVLELLSKDESGMFYRLKDALVVPGR